MRIFWLKLLNKNVYLLTEESFRVVSVKQLFMSIVIGSKDKLLGNLFQLEQGNHVTQGNK